ncbi:hypothetical protein PTKIN_Ptkin02bG0132100 [Pterospermum kingtungense]
MIYSFSSLIVNKPTHNAYGAGLAEMNIAYNYGKVALFVLATLSRKENGVVAGLEGCGLIMENGMVLVSLSFSTLQAPLLIGCDVRSTSIETSSIIGNKEVIVVNQDPIRSSGDEKQYTFGQGHCHGEGWW